ncbi:DUF2790 domain-containing protein [Pseudomonas frederiksbergensis]|uniref:DUF2790 domain-containing protein n=1 Tax=Pseudomonas frederiksbergensis TaxID=104087 RepID=UPI00197DE2B3|nr:DUF2790 domain-containing protein [Pseudomonas frederiksbergensis]MBN3862468.1 DUF2790 domain-containing protein [Pseudomonas frederiksbergensis]
MNMRTLLITTALTCSAFAGFAQANETASSQAVPYHYGMQLHVGKVISMTEPSTLECKVITASMKYIDSASGKPAEITYLKFSDACRYEN